MYVFTDEIILTSGGPASPERTGQTITISVLLAPPSDAVGGAGGGASHQLLIGSTCVSGRTKWDMLDAIVKRTFKVRHCVSFDRQTTARSFIQFPTNHMRHVVRTVYTGTT